MTQADRQGDSGFIMAAVLILSLVILTVISSVVSSTTVYYSGNHADHYQNLANEAAESGVGYATSCLILSNHLQTWGPAAGKPNLMPPTDCNGSSVYSSTNTYIYSDSTVRTYFTVGNLDNSDTFSAQVSATGYAEVLRPDNTVSKTYTSVVKKFTTWDTVNNTTMTVAGTNRSCAIVGGNVYCWGQNRYGQLGNGQYLEKNVGYYGYNAAPGYDSLTPVQVVRAPGVMAGKTIVKIFAESWHTCALSSDGVMYCWGVNYAGQLGDGTFNDSAVPVQVGGVLAGKVITDIGGSLSTSCAIAEQKIYCWGLNTLGQTGVGYTSTSIQIPTLVKTLNTATNLNSSYQATALSTSGTQSASMCAIANSKAYCWGQNEQGEVGDGTFTDKYLPTKVYDSGALSGKSVTAISQDGFYSSSDRAAYPLVHACAVASGSVYCWGENYWSQLGNYSLSSAGWGYSNTPVATDKTGTLFGAGVVVNDVAVGTSHSCALTTIGVSCWGKNLQGQDGTNAGGYTWWYNPHAVDQLSGGLTSSNVVSIGAGANRGCAIISDGRSFCWGLNDYGQIGDGTTVNRFQPTEALFLRPYNNQYIF